MITIRSTAQGEARLTADAMVRELFGAHHIERLSSGAPYIVDADGKPMATSISISHTDSYVAIMDCSEPCGVDIELMDRRVEHLSLRFACEGELAVCRTIFPANPALMVWCAKEALYKVLGREGVDFRRDLSLVSACGGGLGARAFGQIINLEWFVRPAERLLVVATPSSAGYIEGDSTDFQQV